MHCKIYIGHLSVELPHLKKNNTSSGGRWLWSSLAFFSLILANCHAFLRKKVVWLLVSFTMVLNPTLFFSETCCTKLIAGKKRNIHAFPKWMQPHQPEFELGMLNLFLFFSKHYQSIPEVVVKASTGIWIRHAEFIFVFLRWLSYITRY